MENQKKPDNYLVWAILCTILCCLPLGIVSIVYAAKVDGLYSSGDFDGAQEAADNGIGFVFARFDLIVVIGGTFLSVANQ